MTRTKTPEIPLGVDPSLGCLGALPDLVSCLSFSPPVMRRRVPIDYVLRTTRRTTLRLLLASSFCRFSFELRVILPVQRAGNSRLESPPVRVRGDF